MFGPAEMTGPDGHVIWNMLCSEWTVLRHKVNSDAEDEKVNESTDCEYYEQITDIARFLLFLLKQKEKLYSAIRPTKNSMDLDIDSQVSLNTLRQSVARKIKVWYCTDPKWRLMVMYSSAVYDGKWLKRTVFLSCLKQLHKKEQQETSCCSYCWISMETVIRICSIGTFRSVPRAYRLSTDGSVPPFCHL